MLPDGIGIGNALWSHQRFATLWQGALGQAQHLRAYCGKKVPEDEVVQPRYFYVLERNRILDWEAISWAGAGYGAEVVRLGREFVEIGQ